jgi:hypothetical protein
MVRAAVSRNNRLCLASRQAVSASLTSCLTRPSLTDKEIFMRRMVRALGLGVVAMVAAHLGLACGGAQITVAGPAPAGRPTCASVCQQMAGCPVKGPACPQSCQAAQSLSQLGGCEVSLQAELDCLGAQTADVCSAARNACQVQTTALGACIANYCTHPRPGADTAAWCLQAASGF